MGGRDDLGKLWITGTQIVLLADVNGSVEEGSGKHGSQGRGRPLRWRRLELQRLVRIQWDGTAGGGG
jgi:hypothetical protein